MLILPDAETLRNHKAIKRAHALSDTTNRLLDAQVDAKELQNFRAPTEILEVSLNHLPFWQEFTKRIDEAKYLEKVDMAVRRLDADIDEYILENY